MNYAEKYIFQALWSKMMNCVSADSFKLKI